MELRALLVTAVAACLLAHATAQPELPNSVKNFVITPAQPVARRPWTIQFEYTPTGSGAASKCSRLTTAITQPFTDQLPACKPAKSYSRVASGGKKCLMTVHCGDRGNTVGGLQTLQATIEFDPPGNKPVEIMETFTVANAPYTNNLCMLPSGPWLNKCTGCTYTCSSGRTASCDACPCSSSPSTKCAVTTSTRFQSCDVFPPPPLVLKYNQVQGAFQRVCPAATGTGDR